MEETTTPRRWFSFRLRTMFIVVLFMAIALGWWKYHANWMEQRNSFLSKIDNRASYRVDFSPYYYPKTGLVHQPEDCVLPFGLRLFGDERDAINQMFLGKSSTSEVKRVRELFPEADIFWEDKKGFQGIKRYKTPGVN